MELGNEPKTRLQDREGLQEITTHVTASEGLTLAYGEVGPGTKGMTAL